MMINEKMKILKMLEEGRISAEDAAKLLEGGSLEGGPAGSSAPPPAVDHSYAPRSNDGVKGYASSGKASDRPGDSPGGKPADTAGRRESGSTGDLGRKLESFFSDMEPKLQRFAETVVEKTAGAADALSKSFSSARAASAERHPEGPRQPHSPPRPPAPSPIKGPAPGPRGRIEREFELKVTESGSELILNGFNGQVHLKGYNGDKITAKIYYTPKRGNPAVELMTLGSKYYLNYEESEMDSLSVDAYIPETMFSAIRASNNNGPMVISTLRAAEARFENQNGDIEVSGFSARDLLIETNNGNMRLKSITADRLGIDDFNGAISAQDIDAAQMKMSTFNGGITFQTSNFTHFSEYKWAVESNNGKTSMILPSSLDVGYYVRANAALSEVRIGLTGLSYIQNTKSFAEAESTNFDQAAKKVTLILETSNAPLVVN